MIEVRYFASLVDAVGRSAETVEDAGGLTVQELWDRLKIDHPSLADVGFRPLVACDREYSDWDRPLAGVREVAFLPPVSGG